MVIARAPVRLSFGGGGTDLAAYYETFGGFVVSAAITRYSYVMASIPPDGGVRVNSADYRVWLAYERGCIPAVDEPLSLPKAAIERYAERGLRETGVDLFLTAEAPPGTGLGSSSAMAVALAQAMSAITGTRLDPASAAAEACGLEIERLGMPIGKQDQYASAFGGLNTIEFTQAGVTVRPLPVPRDVAQALSDRLLLFSTGRSREASSILRQQQADTGTKPAVQKRLHEIKALAYLMCDVLVAGELDQFGLLLHRAWEEKRRISSHISSVDIDRWYAAARQAGAIGGKIAGAGGGGFMLLYVPPARQSAVRTAMLEHGLAELRFDFDWAGAQVMDAGGWAEHAMATGQDSYASRGV